MKSKIEFTWVVALFALIVTVFSLNLNPAFAADSTPAVPSVAQPAEGSSGGSSSGHSAPIPIPVPLGPNYAAFMAALQSPEIFEISLYSQVRQAWFGASSQTMVTPGRGGDFHLIAQWNTSPRMGEVLGRLRQIVKIGSVNTDERLSVYMSVRDGRGRELFGGGDYEYLKYDGEGVYYLPEDITLRPNFFGYFSLDGVDSVEFIPNKESPEGSYRRQLDRDKNGDFMVPWVLSQQAGTLVFYPNDGRVPVAFDLRSGKQAPITNRLVDGGHAILPGFYQVTGPGKVDFTVQIDEGGYHILPKFEWTFKQGESPVIDINVTLPSGAVPYVYYIYRMGEDPSQGFTIPGGHQVMGLGLLGSYYIVPVFRPIDVNRPPVSLWSDGHGEKG